MTGTPPASPPGDPGPGASGARHRLARTALVGVGIGATALAVVGAFVPVLPTVPLLLLAAACFARGSHRLHRWLMDHRRLGPLVRAYGDGRVPRRAKVTAIGVIWVSITASVLVVPLVWVRVVLITVAAGVTVYLWRLPTRGA